MLSHEEARRFYDRIGRLQDTQAFYEDPATEAVLGHGDFASAKDVFEFGCGTGRFGLRLLADFLPTTARYRGVDVSPRMVSIARQRLSAYADRARISLSDGGPPTGEPTAGYDRFIANYVLDLLSDEEAEGVVGEAHRMLRPDGLICLVSLATGFGRVSRAVARAWTRVAACCPALVGGCRPIDLHSHLPVTHWTIAHQVHVVAFGVPTEAVVARRV
jgi:SAM-dependent methyltransferase